MNGFGLNRAALLDKFFPSNLNPGEWRHQAAAMLGEAIATYNPNAGTLTVQDVLNRLADIERCFYGEEVDSRVAMLKLDIETHCRRNGIPFS